VTLLIPIGAAIVSPLLPAGDRKLSAGLLLLGGVVLAVLWGFSSATESRIFRRILLGAVILALFTGSGYLLFVHPARPPAATVIRGPALPPKAPKLYFELGASAHVPYCSTYEIQVQGPVPAGYQIVAFDAPTDNDGNVNGYYNFDPPAPAGNIPGRVEVPDITVGDQSAVPGFQSVVIAAVITDSEAGILENVRPVPSAAGWHVKQLPVLLTSKALYVTRTSTDSSC
jgi:hypothetical protein